MAQPLNNAPKKKIAIIGTRTYEDYRTFEDKVSHFLPLSADEIVSGGASGTDKMAKKYANRNGYTYTEFPANWEQHGKAAGPIRNEQIAEYCDMVIAFWDYESIGTRNMIGLAKKYNKNVIIIGI